MIVQKSERTTMKISPRARKAAETKGIPLEAVPVPGSGFDGGICEKDILAFAETYRASPGEGAAAAGRAGGRKATPLAGAIAAAEGLALLEIAGSGIGGKIVSRDVKAALAIRREKKGTLENLPESRAEAPERKDPEGREVLEEIPYAGIRRIIGEKLASSMQQAPHIFFTQKADLENLLALRRQVNQAQCQKTSVTDFIVRAAVMALQKYPEMNGIFTGETIVRFRTVNIGIAVAAESGLIVPVIKNAEKMSVTEIAAAGAALIGKARNGRLAPDEYTGGNFTVSNLGMFGIENFTAIINPPELGILAVSGAKEEAAVRVLESGEKTIQCRTRMNIQLSADHRAIDGLLAARFVTEIRDLLENPIRLLL